MDKSNFTEIVKTFRERTESHGIVVYAKLKSGDEKIKKLNIDEESRNDLKRHFVDQLSRMAYSENLDIIALSDADERGDVIYHYDLEIPEELQILNSIRQSDGLPFFLFSEHEISDIDAILVEIGDDEEQIVLYKAIQGFDIYKQSTLMLGFKDNSRFIKMEDDLLRITRGFQMLQIGDSLLITNLKALESIFGFSEIVSREAEKGIVAIEQMDIVEDLEGLKESALNMTFARKLSRVATNSPVINAGLSNSAIIEFCRSRPRLNNAFKFNDDNSKIILNTKKSQTEFVRLLMDDFLNSRLTQIKYAALAKDAVD